MFESDHSHILPENALEYPSQHIFLESFTTYISVKLFDGGEQCEKKIKIAHATLRTVMVLPIA